MYDALLLVSFGGPEGMEDVIPFLENVLRGRNVPRDRMMKVAEHYQRFGGVSPINEQNRNLIAALETQFALHGPTLPIYWGNRNWRPMLADAIEHMRSDGIKNALAFVTSAFSSYSSCRQYRENIAEARSIVGDKAPLIDKLRPFYNHPLFIEANVENLRAAIKQSPGFGSRTSQLIFTAHSIPQSMATNCSYEVQLQEASRLITSELEIENYRLVYQSRSGAPSTPWLGPDICEYLRELKAAEITDVVIAPIGFVSDHMEIIYDLDTEARQLCDELGIRMIRAATVGTHPLFVEMIRQLILEKMERRDQLEVIGNLGPSPHQCPTDCCLPGEAAQRPPVVSNHDSTIRSPVKESGGTVEL